MKPLSKTTAFILESESKELPKKVTEAIIAIGKLRKWEVNYYYYWKVETPKPNEDWENVFNTYLINSGVKLNSYVFIHF